MGWRHLGHLVCPWTQAPQNGCPLAHCVTVCERRRRFTSRHPPRPAVRRGHGESQYSLCVHESKAACTQRQRSSHLTPWLFMAHRALERVRCFGCRSLVPGNRHSRHSRHTSTGRARGHSSLFQVFAQKSSSRSTVVSPPSSESSGGYPRIRKKKLEQPKMM